MLNIDPNEGLGEVAPKDSGAEMRLAHRSFRERWPVSPAVRAKVVMRALQIVDAENTTNRDRCAAMRVLLAADALNAQREATETSADSSLSQSQAQIIRAAIAAHPELVASLPMPLASTIKANSPPNDPKPSQE
jgi:hypothetical protein